MTAHVVAPIVVDLEEQIRKLAEDQAVLLSLARENTEALAKVRAELRLAKGTRDVTGDAAKAVAIAAPPTTVVLPPPVAPANDTGPSLAERVEQTLRNGIHSLDDLCKIVRAPAGPVSAILKRARAHRQIYNVGSEERPRWVWILGDEAPTREVYAMVALLIADRPFEFSELQAATGARRGRVSGAIVDLQKHGRRVVNRGQANRARWFLMEKGAGSVGKRTHARRAA
jgi:hypothetical protein